MKTAVILLVTLLSFNAFAKDVKHVCAPEAKAKAIKLYNLHMEFTENIDDPNVILSDVSQVPSLKSPDKKMSYDVLEVDATPGKMGYYRMRFIFAVLNEAGVKPVATDCILMGQEILDMSSL